jgi:hypothetical protein
MQPVLPAIRTYTSSKRGESKLSIGVTVPIDDLRERVLAVLDHDDVATNNDDTDLLAGDILEGRDKGGL